MKATEKNARNTLLKFNPSSCSPRGGQTGHYRFPKGRRCEGWLCREPQEASSILMPLYIQLAEQAYKLGDDVLPLYPELLIFEVSM
jgi:hypothetical protein